jgi:hypothetical protein
MKKISIFLGALGVAILAFNHLVHLQNWVFNFGFENGMYSVEESQRIPLDSVHGFPVLGFLVLAIASFVGSISYKKSVFTWAGVVFLVIVIGYLFKLLGWPGENIILTLSFSVFIIIVIPWLTAFLMLYPQETVKVEPVEDVSFKDEPIAIEKGDEISGID